MNNTQGGRGGGGAAVGGISLPVKQECIHKMLNNSHDWKQSGSQKFFWFFCFLGGAGGFKGVSDLRAGRIIFGSAAVSSQAAFSEIREVPDVADRRSDWHGHIQTTRKFTDRGYTTPPPAPPNQPLPPLINPTHKELHDRTLQKKSDTFVAKIGRAVLFFYFLPPAPLPPRNICKLRNRC